MRLDLLAVRFACAPKLAELDRENAAALARSNQHLAAVGTPFTPIPVSIADLGCPGTCASCAQTARCSSSSQEYASYAFATAADGRVIVTRNTVAWWSWRALTPRSG